MEAMIAMMEQMKRHAPATYALHLDANPAVNHHHLVVFVRVPRATNWMTASREPALTSMNAQSLATVIRLAKIIGRVSHVDVWVLVFGCRWFTA